MSYFTVCHCDRCEGRDDGPYRDPELEALRVAYDGWALYDEDYAHNMGAHDETPEPTCRACNPPVPPATPRVVLADDEDLPF